MNECEEGISGCQQICINTNVTNVTNMGYYCNCYSGYHLEEDGHMCEGE